MKIIKKNVYYCEYCKKKGLSIYHIRKHETGCTVNPNRRCGWCEGNNIGNIVAEFKQRFKLYENPNLTVDEYAAGANIDTHRVEWLAAPVTLKDVLHAVDECPVCTLAVLRQTGFNLHYFHFDEYDYKKQIEFWQREQRNSAPSCY